MRAPAALCFSLFAFAPLSLWAQNAVPIRNISGNVPQGVSTINSNTSNNSSNNMLSPQVGGLPPSATRPSDPSSINNAEIYEDEDGMQQRCYGVGCADRMAEQVRERRAHRQKSQDKQFQQMMKEEQQYKKPAGANTEVINKDFPTSPEVPAMPQAASVPDFSAAAGSNKAAEDSLQGNAPQAKQGGVNIMQLPTGALRAPAKE